MYPFPIILLHLFLFMCLRLLTSVVCVWWQYSLMLRPGRSPPGSVVSDVESVAWNQARREHSHRRTGKRCTSKPVSFPSWRASWETSTNISLPGTQRNCPKQEKPRDPGELPVYFSSPQQFQICHWLKVLRGLGRERTLQEYNNFKTN